MIQRNTMTELLKQIADFINPESAPQSAPAAKAASVLEDRMRAVMPDELTPKEALALVYELRSLVKP